MKDFKPDEHGYITILTEKDLKRCYYLMIFSTIILLLYLTGLYENINFLTELNPVRRILTLLGRCDIINC